MCIRDRDKNTSGDGSFRYVEGTLGGNHVILTQCGIGKVSACLLYTSRSVDEICLFVDSICCSCYASLTLMSVRRTADDE